MNGRFSTCPVCAHHFGWKERLKFGRWFSRTTAECPQCGRSLTWNRWPWRLAMTGCVSILPANLVAILLLELASIPESICSAIGAVPCLLIFSAFWIRLVEMDDANQRHQRTPLHGAAEP